MQYTNEMTLSHSGTQAAFGAQHKAEKRAQEKIRENHVLRAELLALKGLLRNSQEKQANFAMRRSVSSNEALLPPVEFSQIRRAFRQHTDAQHTASLPQGFSRPRMSSASRPSLSTSIVSLTTQEPVTRKSLYEALTADGSCSLNTHSKYYKVGHNMTLKSYHFVLKLTFNVCVQYSSNSRLQ
ncbi:unnamed protein product [Schistocephalus solidus]|uniref:Uncharacterized protein n=1 Tax=Schistocephalus solidus TaxID=70667 RepID=A0A183T2A3_SCHSO|nr:unnamed protein product [Schistocephalus solidus]